MGDLCGVSDHDDRAAERAFFLSDVIDWFFDRGHAADLILAVLLVELVWLIRSHRWPLRSALLRLLPGAFMIIALRAALTGAGWPWVALALLCSFPAHLADLAIGRPRRD